MTPPRALTICASPAQATAFLRYLARRGIVASAREQEVVALRVGMAALSEAYGDYLREEAAERLAAGGRG